ncbi:hypothetical protein M0657_003410 [Pyricularia oryzae]|uniref:Uncharacterized protein n=3 Tax=Pyricularia oryzae TaxID=318829 RepID=A0A4V1C6Y3_PYROR|nr:hypothetical protein OOU_Y34scaffold00095g41 [Pyricularia oryzae Y34]KAI7925810.1 hypothetical protein M9X92_003050 [Pyricularia oryzae]KAI7927146.1 hypothetical protein M0657_003410 [Pyricularia oryzae]QBZ61488.1 hypothetical protein PoMZ_08437 [Pyricularia oryzae]
MFMRKAAKKECGDGNNSRQGRARNAAQLGAERVSKSRKLARHFKLLTPDRSPASFSFLSLEGFQKLSL